MHHTSGLVRMEWGANAAEALVAQLRQEKGGHLPGIFTTADGVETAVLLELDHVRNGLFLERFQLRGRSFS